MNASLNGIVTREGYSCERKRKSSDTHDVGPAPAGVRNGICRTVTSRAVELAPRSASGPPPSSLAETEAPGTSASAALPVDMTRNADVSSGNGTSPLAASPVATGLPFGGSEMTFPEPV
jgi:hypothetical protein